MICMLVQVRLNERVRFLNFLIKWEGFFENLLSLFQQVVRLVMEKGIWIRVIFFLGLGILCKERILFFLGCRQFRCAWFLQNYLYYWGYKVGDVRVFFESQTMWGIREGLKVFFWLGVGVIQYVWFIRWSSYDYIYRGCGF